MTKSLSIAGIAAALIAAAGTLYVCKAFAGALPYTPITINTIARTAEGALGSILASPDDNQYIVCLVDAVPGAVGLYCQAKDNRSPTPVLVSCSSTDRTLVDNVQKIATDAWVKFAWNSSKVCTSVTIDRGSKWQLKAR
jgi:hypothetical protein